MISTEELHVLSELLLLVHIFANIGEAVLFIIIIIIIFYIA